MLLECCCDGGFSARREACEPDCESALFAEFIALMAGERWVPGYAGRSVSWPICGCERRGEECDGGVGGVYLLSCHLFCQLPGFGLVFDFAEEEMRGSSRIV